MERAAIFDDVRIIDEQFSDWQGLVKYYKDIFVEAGITESRYFDHIVQDLIENQAYMVIMPGVVLLHSSPDHGVIKKAFYFAKLAYPVFFGHAANDPVRYVITFSSMSSEEHMQAIALIAGMLMDEEFFEGIAAAKTSDELRSFIEGYEKEKLKNA